LFKRDHCGTFAGPQTTRLLCRPDEVRKLGRRVVRRHPRRLVPEQILPVLEGHACRAKPPAEGVLEIMDAHLRQVRATARFLPGGVVHGLDRPEPGGTSTRGWGGT
jgi:hypothetical protein